MNQQTTLSPHFLQSEAWEAFQADLGRRVLRDQGDGWSWMAFVEEGKLTKRLYCPYGPTTQSEKALQEACISLRQCAKAEGADYIRIEPMVEESVELGRLGAVRAVRDVQPAHTLRIDLTRAEEDILMDITSGNRRAYTGAAKRGMTFRKSRSLEDLGIFLNAIHEVAAATGMHPHTDSYFKKQMGVLLPLEAASILIAEVGSKPAASMIVYDDGKVRYYAHAAAHYEFHKLQPAAALLVYAMLDAKTMGLQAFDMYGVSPPDEPNHPWAGFSRFKRSFGGEEVAFSGTWDISVNRLKHGLERTVHRLHRTARAGRQKLYAQQKRLKRLRLPRPDKQ